MRQTLVVITLVSVILLTCTRPVSAKREFLEKFQIVFGLSDKTLGKCVLCHNVSEKDKPGKGNLGVYGKELQQVLSQNESLKANPELLAVMIFKRDSDGDGVSNQEEFALATFPGDPKSLPSKEALDAYRKKVAQVEAKRGGTGAAAGPAKKEPAKKK